MYSTKRVMYKTLAASPILRKSISAYSLNRGHTGRKNEHQKIRQVFFTYRPNTIHQNTWQTISFLNMTDSFLQSTTQDREDVYFRERQEHLFTKPIVCIQLKYNPKVLIKHITSYALHDRPWYISRRYTGLVRSPSTP